MLFNGPFSDSAATLNSIYHPNDLSKFGIENFALIQPTLNLSRMGPCTVGLYGVLTKYFRPSEPDIDAQHPGFDGRFDGQRLRFKWPTGIIPGASFTVMNDVHMTLSEARAAAPPGYDLAHGYMDLSNPYLTHTLAGQDAYETVKVQVIELGNSLTKISGTMSDEQMVVSDRTPNPGNPYAATKVPGLKLWNCLLGINN